MQNFLNNLIPFVATGFGAYLFFFKFTSAQRTWVFKMFGALIEMGLSAGAGKETQFKGFPPFPRADEKTTGNFELEDVPQKVAPHGSDMKAHNAEGSKFDTGWTQGNLVRVSLGNDEGQSVQFKNRFCGPKGSELNITPGKAYSVLAHYYSDAGINAHVYQIADDSGKQVLALADVSERSNAA